MTNRSGEIMKQGTLVFAQHLPMGHQNTEIEMRVDHDPHSRRSGHVYLIFLDGELVEKYPGYANEAYRRCNEIAGCDLGALRGFDIERSMGG